MNCGTTNYGCENTVEFETEVAGASLPITRIHLQVIEESKIHQLPATLHNTEWMDERQIQRRSFDAIPILDPVDVE